MSPLLVDAPAPLRPRPTGPAGPAVPAGPGPRPGRHDPFAAAGRAAAARCAGMRLRPGLRTPFALPMAAAAGPHVRDTSGRELVNLGSNNYLGLTLDPRVREAAAAALRRYGTGASGSRVLNGTLGLHLELEAELADFHRVPAAALFSTGFTANLGLLGGAVTRHDTLLLDQRVHSSVQVGAAAGPARVLRFAHDSAADLDRRLGQVPLDSGAVVVVDGVYSMEGHVADLPGLGEVCRRHGALLVVDEAHGLGVLGAAGRGAAEATGAEHAVAARTITLSKALASCGGAVLGSADLVEALRVQAPSYAFQASNTPASVAAALAALRVLRAEPERLGALRANAARLRAGLVASGCDVLPGQAAIVAVEVGDDACTVRAWNALYDAGVYVNAAVHPAVPAGRGLLRMSVLATQSPADLDRAVAHVADAVAAARAGAGA